MTQKLTYAIAAGMIAFMVVLLGALGAYIVIHGPANQVAAAGTTSGIVAPPSGTAAGTGSGNAGTESGDNSQDGENSAYPVTAEQATSIALNTVAGSSLMQAPRLVNYQGTAAYEVQLNVSLLYVDATTGQVLYNSATDRQQRRGPRR